MKPTSDTMELINIMNERMFEVNCDHRLSLELIGDFYDPEKKEWFKEYNCKMCGKIIRHKQ